MTPLQAFCFLSCFPRCHLGLFLFPLSVLYLAIAKLGAQSKVGSELRNDKREALDGLPLLDFTVLFFFPLVTYVPCCLTWYSVASDCIRDAQ
jgi:hypothetical protein